MEDKQVASSLVINQLVDVVDVLVKYKIQHQAKYAFRSNNVYATRVTNALNSYLKQCNLWGYSDNDYIFTREFLRKNTDEAVAYVRCLYLMYSLLDVKVEDGRYAGKLVDTYHLPLAVSKLAKMFKSRAILKIYCYLLFNCFVTPDFEDSVPLMNWVYKYYYEYMLSVDSDDLIAVIGDIYSKNKCFDIKDTAKVLGIVDSGNKAKGTAVQQLRDISAKIEGQVPKAYHNIFKNVANGTDRYYSPLDVILLSWYLYYSAVSADLDVAYDRSFGLFIDYDPNKFFTFAEGKIDRYKASATHDFIKKELGLRDALLARSQNSKSKENIGGKGNKKATNSEDAAVTKLDRVKAGTKDAVKSDTVMLKYKDVCDLLLLMSEVKAGSQQFNVINDFITDLGLNAGDARKLLGYVFAVM